MTLHTDDDGEPLPTYERQAGKHPGVDNVACFEDLNKDAVWRPPNSEEIDLLAEEAPGHALSVHVAVIDGRAGPMGVLVDDDGTTQVVDLQKYEDPDPERITVGCEVEAFDLDPQHTDGKELLARGTVEGIKTQAGRMCFEIRADDAPLRSQEGNLIPVWERADREIERVDAD